MNSFTASQLQALGECLCLGTWPLRLLLYPYIPSFQARVSTSRMHMSSPPRLNTEQRKHTANMATRTPIIPHTTTAKKATTLLCDDASHYTPGGKPKKLKGTTIDERQECMYTKKLLLYERADSRFCIVHDHGVGSQVFPSGQWWEAEGSGYVGVAKAAFEYKCKIEGQNPWSNWWESNVGSSMSTHFTAPQVKERHGLQNKVSKGSPEEVKSEVSSCSHVSPHDEQC